MAFPRPTSFVWVLFACFAPFGCSERDDGAREGGDAAVLSRGAPQRSWVRHLPPPAELWDVSADAAGNVTVLGGSLGATLPSDADVLGVSSQAFSSMVFVASFTEDGAPRWSLGLDAESFESEVGGQPVTVEGACRGVAIATGGAGEVYVTGYFTGQLAFAPDALPCSTECGFVVGISADGDLRWTRRFSPFTRPSGIASGESGEDGALVVGVGLAHLGAADFGGGPVQPTVPEGDGIYLVRFASDGEISWARFFGSRAGGNVALSGAAVDSAGKNHLIGIADVGDYYPAPPDEPPRLVPRKGTFVASYASGGVLERSVWFQGGPPGDVEALGDRVFAAVPARPPAGAEGTCATVECDVEVQRLSADEEPGFALVPGVRGGDFRVATDGANAALVATGALLTAVFADQGTVEWQWPEEGASGCARRVAAGRATEVYLTTRRCVAATDAETPAGESLVRLAWP